MKKIVFLTGTRADFGKIRSIILSLIDTKKIQSGRFCYRYAFIAQIWIYN